jgi:hypothetical protein
MNPVREAFEAWTKRVKNRTDAGYVDDHTRVEWNAWSAACHWMRERELEDVERLVRERLERR